MEFGFPHTGANIAKQVMNMLSFFNLADKLFYIAMDDASNNNTMARELSDILYIDHGIRWNADTQHLYCLTHIINLVMKKLIDRLATNDA